MPAAIPETLSPLVVPIESVHPYGDNPREGDVGAICVSLERNGQYRPIVVNKRDGQILAGNHTWKAAVQLGWDGIAATFVDVDEETAKRIVLVDNRSNDLAAYDDSVLAALLEGIVDESGVDGLVGTGFDGDDLDELLADAAPPDWDGAFDTMSAGESSHTQVTFTLSPQQKADVDDALDSARGYVTDVDREDNANANGCALAVIARSFNP